VGVLVLVISTVLALALGTAALRRFDTPVWPVVAAAFVAAADFITYAAFGIGCSDVIENPPERWIDACRAYPEPLPLVGIVAVLGEASPHGARDDRGHSRLASSSGLEWVSFRGSPMATRATTGTAWSSNPVPTASKCSWRFGH
jgi:hypothetical protein